MGCIQFDLPCTYIFDWNVECAVLFCFSTYFCLVKDVKSSRSIFMTVLISSFHAGQFNKSTVSFFKNFKNYFMLIIALWVELKIHRPHYLQRSKILSIQTNQNGCSGFDTNLHLVLGLKFSCLWGARRRVLLFMEVVVGELLVFVSGESRVSYQNFFSSSYLIHLSFLSVEGCKKSLGRRKTLFCGSRLFYGGYVSLNQ